MGRRTQVGLALLAGIALGVGGVAMRPRRVPVIGFQADSRDLKCRIVAREETRWLGQRGGGAETGEITWRCGEKHDGDQVALYCYCSPPEPPPK